MLVHTHYFNILLLRYGTTNSAFWSKWNKFERESLFQDIVYVCMVYYKTRSNGFQPSPDVVVRSLHSLLKYPTGEFQALQLIVIAAFGAVD